MKTKITASSILSGVMKYGIQILFMAAIVIIAALSFVKDFGINSSIKHISITTIVFMVLNWIIWDGYYGNSYNKVMSNDINNKSYSVHKRYYAARKGWKYDDLQNKIHLYNLAFINAWKEDIQDITGRTISEIEKGGYKGFPHKYLIYKVKHKKYPRSGIRTPKDLLYLLSVGVNKGMKMHLKTEELYRNAGRAKKIITSLLSAYMAAAIVFEFITGDSWKSALVTMLFAVVTLFSSLFFGSMAGNKGGRMKLSTVEQVCEKLEEWKNEGPTQYPFESEGAETNDEVENEDVPIEGNNKIIEIV